MPANDTLYKAEGRAAVVHSRWPGGITQIVRPAKVERSVSISI